MSDRSMSRKQFRDIQYEEWGVAAAQLKRLIEKGSAQTKPWPYRNPRGTPNVWKVKLEPSQVSLAYKPGYNAAGKVYSQWVSRKGTPRSRYSVESIYMKEIKPILLPIVTNDLLDRVAKKVSQYFRVKIADSIDSSNHLNINIGG